MKSIFEHSQSRFLKICEKLGPLRTRFSDIYSELDAFFRAAEVSVNEQCQRLSSQKGYFYYINLDDPNSLSLARKMRNITRTKWRTLFDAFVCFSETKDFIKFQSVLNKIEEWITQTCSKAASEVFEGL